ncbi:hypothetical protein D9613_001033 [Agrocybe pediades]|uniref:Uncharacterized protein n=1 Tax=Agrocybe pediades TaxID=84607 RepID=A0A8H4R213_9AGAR|nr:hypothetical protein D9613_001033 [Agrocybe pediades]
MLGQKYPVNTYVLLTQKGVNHLTKKFGTISYADQPWVITAHSFTMFSSTYTIKNIKGSQYEGVKEEHIEPIPEEES